MQVPFPGLYIGLMSMSSLTIHMPLMFIQMSMVDVAHTMSSYMQLMQDPLRPL